MLKKIKLKYQNMIKISDQKNDTTKVSLVIICKTRLKSNNKYSSNISEAGYLRYKVSLNALLITSSLGFLGGF